MLDSPYSALDTNERPLYFSNLVDGPSYAVLEFFAGVSESNGGSVPEPATILLLGLGLAALEFTRQGLHSLSE